MTTELTLREKVLDCIARLDDPFTAQQIADQLASLLAATGAPAYIRVAQDLRGEWEPGVGDDVTTPATKGD